MTATTVVLISVTVASVWTAAVNKALAVVQRNLIEAHEDKGASLERGIAVREEYIETLKDTVALRDVEIGALRAKLDAST